VAQITVRAPRWRKVVVPYLYLLPFIILFIAFRVFPLLYGLELSLTNTRLGRLDSAFVGLNNFANLASDRRFIIGVQNTFTFALEATIPVLGVPLLVAVLLNRPFFGRDTIRSIFFFPYTLSAATLALIWAWLLDPLVGPLNYYLKLFGVAPPQWLGDPNWAMPSVVGITVWWVTGYYMIIFLAAMQDIPLHLYEAASIDGANAWQSFWRITFPLMRRTFLFVVVIHLVGAFQVFAHIHVLTHGGPADATRTVVQHIYETAFQNRFELGTASAMSWVLLLLIVVFSALQFRLIRER
jgi:multiple sugar transport system permease protein